MQTVTLRITNKIETAARNMLANDQDWVADDVGLPEGYLVVSIEGEAWIVWQGATCNVDGMKKILKIV